VYIDAGDSAGRVIEISAGTRHYADAVPVLFKRTRLTAPMPEPVAGGDISRLWEFVPVRAEDRPRSTGGR